MQGAQYTGVLLFGFTVFFVFFWGVLGFRTLRGLRV